MGYRSYTAKEFATSDPTLFIEVNVRYAGKPEYSSAEQQGYWLSIVPFRREVKDGFVWRTTTAYSGVKKFLEPATRYSEKYMYNLALDWEWINEWAENKAMLMDVELVKEAA